MRRPSFAAAWARFMDVRVPLTEVGSKIGGKVQANIQSGIFQNACPIRMSYVLNRTGVQVPAAGYASVSGADGRFYIYRVNDMIRYLEGLFGKPDKAAKAPKPKDFSGFKGLLVVKGHGWANAQGHVTLWNGTGCSYSCHLSNDPDNGPFAPDVGLLWTLP